MINYKLLKVKLLSNEIFKNSIKLIYKIYIIEKLL
jgi:hypothetical protein